MFTNARLLMPANKKAFLKMVAIPAIVFAAEEADQFIDYIKDESVLKNNARIIKMNKVTKNVRALGLGEKRFLYPGEGFVSGDYLKTLSDQKIPLIAKKMRGCIAIYDDDLADNIEGDAFADHVMRMVTSRIANELDEAFWIGDTASIGGFGPKDIRSLFDGWRYRILCSQAQSGYLSTHYNDVSGRATLMTALNETDYTTGLKTLGMIVEPTTPNGFVYICSVAGTASAEPTWPVILGNTVVDGGVTWRCHAYDFALAGKIGEKKTTQPFDWEFKYSMMLKRLPSKYKQVGMKNLRFFHSDQITQDYVNALSARSTILGDQAILGTAPIQYGQVPLVSCPKMAMTMSAAGVLDAGIYGDCLLTPKGNLILGIYREIKVEAQRVAADEATYWFYTMRADNAIENVNACVLTEKLITA